MFDLQGIGATLLFTVDGADTETVDRIRRHLAVAVNSFLIMFDAKTAEPAAAITKPDGGPRVLPWEKFERSCVSEIMAFFGQRGGWATWADLSVDEYDRRCNAISEGVREHWDGLSEEEYDDKCAALCAAFTVARKEAIGTSLYLTAAAKRGDPNPPAPICLPARTHCPGCGNALGNRVIVHIEVNAAQVREGRDQGSVSPIIRFQCPLRETCGTATITDATKRAAVLATIPDGEGGDEVEKAIVERMALEVDRFNCALAKKKGKKKGAASKPFVLPAFVTVPKGPQADDIVVAENGEEVLRGCFHCGQQFPSATGHWLKGPAGPRTLCTCCGTRFARGLSFSRPQRV